MGGWIHEAEEGELTRRSEAEMPAAGVLEALVVYDEAFDRVFLESRGRPGAELDPPSGNGHGSRRRKWPPDCSIRSPARPAGNPRSELLHILQQLLPIVVRRPRRSTSSAWK